MADQARVAKEKPPQSPLKTKVVRSQKIAQAASPIDSRQPPAPLQLQSALLQSALDLEDSDGDIDGHGGSDAPASAPAPATVTERAAPPIPRSHTPGHLAFKSQDRRRKPSEVSIRQRSQSATAQSPGSANIPSLSASTSFIVPQSKTPAPPSASIATPAQQRPNNSENGEGLTGDSFSGRDGNIAAVGGRRPPGMRSTSAIAGRPNMTGSGSGLSYSARHATTAARGSSGSASVYGPHTFFPPLADSKTGPDVPAAPSSGMYWSRAPVSGATHPALRAHTTTLVGSNVFVFGGCDSRACFSDLYVLDADAFYWSAPHVVGDVPSPLRAMTCTAVGKKLVIFGGGDGPAYYNDVYVLDTVNFRWSKPKILGDKVPSKRRAHTACLYKNGIYVFGGGDGIRALNDIWRLDVSDVNKMSWKLVSHPTSGEKSPGDPNKDNRPKARGYHTANMVGSKLIIYGGSDGGECFNDVWVYDVETHVWKSVNIPVTFRRLSHTATIVGSYLFVIGGHDGNEYSNDVLLLNLVTMAWDKRKVYGLPPSGRGYHGAVLYDSRLLMIGGFDGSEVFGDTWILELAVHAYYSQISHFTIEV